MHHFWKMSVDLMRLGFYQGFLFSIVNNVTSLQNCRVKFKERSQQLSVTLFLIYPGTPPQSQPVSAPLETSLVFSSFMLPLFGGFKQLWQALTCLQGVSASLRPSSRWSRACETQRWSNAFLPPRQVSLTHASQREERGSDKWMEDVSAAANAREHADRRF